ncbi:MAG: hypothetical protein SVW77_01210 [Candidatus Nanohaloarchaea archaeon]|nr:hypothetical protein [Candidatus Nanohaloarchaea archaeon]
MVVHAVARRQGVVAALAPVRGTGERYDSVAEAARSGGLYEAAAGLDGGPHEGTYSNGERELLYGATVYASRIADRAVSEDGITSAAATIRAQDWGSITDRTDPLRETMLPERGSQLAARYTANRDGCQQAEPERYSGSPERRGDIARTVMQAADDRFGYPRPAVTGIVLAQALHPISIDDKVDTQICDINYRYAVSLLDRVVDQAYPDLW